MSNIQQLEQRNTQLENENNQLKSRITQFERELNENKQLLRQKDANMRTLNSDNDMLKAELGRLAQQNVHLSHFRPLCRQCNMNC